MEWDNICFSLSKARMNARLVSPTSTRPGIKVRDMAGRRTEDHFPKAKPPPPQKPKIVLKTDPPSATPGTRMSNKHRLRKSRTNTNVKPTGEGRSKGRDTTSARFIRRRKQFGDATVQPRSNKSAGRNSGTSRGSKLSSDRSISGRSDGYKKSRKPTRGA